MRAGATERQWGLVIGEYVGPPECSLWQRWYAWTPFGAIRVHRFFRGDDEPLHDHPWAFWTLVLAGSYRDVSEAGVDHLLAGSWRWRPMGYSHRVETDGAWTLVLSGPTRRRWGFWDRGEWTYWRDYRALNGYPPCYERTR
jgi:hypothetical protein